LSLKYTAVVLTFIYTIRWFDAFDHEITMPSFPLLSSQYAVLQRPYNLHYNMRIRYAYQHIPNM